MTGKKRKSTQLFGMIRQQFIKMFLSLLDIFLSKVENFLQILECVRMGVGIRIYRIFLLFKNLEKLSFSISYILKSFLLPPNYIRLL